MKLITLFIASLLLSVTGFAQPKIYVNQVGFDTKAPKIAVIGVDKKLGDKATFTIVNAENKAVFTGNLGSAQTIDDWTPGKIYYKADFSTFEGNGKFKLAIKVEGKQYFSEPFTIEEN